MDMERGQALLNRNKRMEGGSTRVFEIVDLEICENPDYPNYSCVPPCFVAF
jgi:hypothetical protein